MTNIEIMQRRIRERLETLGLSARAVSLTATGKAGAIDNILNKGSQPSYERLEAIAKALGSNGAYLSGIGNSPGVDPWDTADGASPVPTASDMAKDLPIYATDVGKIFEPNAVKKDRIALTMIHSQTVIDYFRRPTAHILNRKMYGIYVAGPWLGPALEAGSVAIVDGTRPPAIRDYVVIYLRSEPASEADDWGFDEYSGRTSTALVGRLAGMSSEHVSFETHDPAAMHRVEASRITNLHRIMSIKDLLGT